ncbi:MAG: sulfatase [Cytophagaceae bacterium SCN 52-12]|nr:MAG: sulfatase [Cytophagaceae bacterium SCN 52-12]
MNEPQHRPAAYVLFSALLSLTLALFLSYACSPKKTEQARPNFLIIMSDNQSWNHLGAYGDSIVKTPHIDRVAQNGVKFTHAFCASPSCTPARAALLMGQEIYRLKEGANLWGTLPTEFRTYPDLLEEAGYLVGYEGKGWGPGNFEASGRIRNPGGNRYENFAAFLSSNKQTDGKPWLYWFSSKDPHRPYAVGSGTAAGIDSSRIKAPSYLPDVPEVKGDIGDYYAAIQHFDGETGTMLRELAESGELENTLIIICSDNGWQMPRGLANLYDFGTRVPLIISWAGSSHPGFHPGRTVDDVVSLNDIAPTLLELAGVRIPAAYTARSLTSLLTSSQNGRIDTSRTFTVMARERHAFVRKNGLGYPGRALRTHDFLYIRNLEPTRWPAGDPPLFGDVDAHMLHYPAPTKVFMLANRDKPEVAPLFRLAFDKRPAEELYDIRNDPDQLINLAGDGRYTEVKDALSRQLSAYLEKTEDPRATGQAVIWDSARYYEPRDFTPKPSKEAKEALKLKDVYNYLED